MPFTRNDMHYKDYSWHARDEHDDPRVTGEPDRTLLDRQEGYEVLYFVNAVGRRQFNSPSVATYQKIERGIRRCPTSTRSQEGIENWIVQNWGSIQ